MTADLFFVNLADFLVQFPYVSANCTQTSVNFAKKQQGLNLILLMIIII